MFCALKWTMNKNVWFIELSEQCRRNCDLFFVKGKLWLSNFLTFYSGVPALMGRGRATGVIYWTCAKLTWTLSHTTSSSLNWREMHLMAVPLGGSGIGRLVALKGWQSVAECPSGDQDKCWSLGLASGLVLLSLDSGTECSNSADGTNLCGVVDTVEGRDGEDKVLGRP